MTGSKRSKPVGEPRTYTYVGRYSQQFKEECKWSSQYLDCTQIEVIEQAMHEMVQRLRSYSLIMAIGEEERMRESEREREGVRA